MGWWARIADGVKYTKNVLGDTAAWTWSWTGTPLITTLTYSANTVYYGLIQLAALRHAIPALAKPESLKVMKAMSYMTVYKILPLITLNYLNTQMRLYVDGQQQDMDSIWNSPALASTVTFTNWGVWGGIQLYGLELAAEAAVILSLAPAAFGKGKSQELTDLPSPCEASECNFKRRVKGSLREIFILALNDALAGGVGYIPYVGKIAAAILDVYFSGDVAIRSAILERCERHRSTDSERLLATGLFYIAEVMLLDALLEATVGMPPFLVHRTLRQFILLFNANNMAHMYINYVPLGKGTLTKDPIIAYERASSFVTDVVFAGTMDEVAKIIQTPNKEPIISLSAVLQKMIQVLNSDLEKENVPEPGFFKRMAKKGLPRMFRSSKEAINDPVIRIFWPNFQELFLDIIDSVEAAGMPVNTLTKTPIPLVARAVKAALPEVLYKKYGISKKLSKFLITLCKDDDFWGFVLALKQWLERHKIREKSGLAIVSDNTLSTLHKGNNMKGIEAPKEGEIATTPVDLNLRSSTTVVDPEKTRVITKASLDPGFFVQRKKKAETFSPPNFSLNGSM